MNYTPYFQLIFNNSNSEWSRGWWRRQMFRDA